MTNQQDATEAPASAALRLAGASVVFLSVALVCLRITRVAAEADDRLWCGAGTCAGPSLQLYLYATAAIVAGFGAAGLALAVQNQQGVRRGTGPRHWVIRLCIAIASAGGSIALCQSALVAVSVTFNH